MQSEQKAKTADVSVDYGDFGELKQSKAYAGEPKDLGKLLYSYSDARAWIDQPRGKRFKKVFEPQRVFLFVFAVLLCVWFLVALIYQLITTENVGKTLLHLLPSLIIIGVASAILFISVCMGWGDLLRKAFKRNLVHGNDPASRRQLAAMKEEIKRADARKICENRLDVTPDYVVLVAWGEEYILHRHCVTAEVEKHGVQLTVTLNVAGTKKQFPVPLPEEEYVPLKKAMRDQLTTVRSKPSNKKVKLKQIVKEIPALLMMLLILAAGVMLVVTHYVWVESIPPFLGVCFIGASFLALCNILSFLPAVSQVGLPLTVSLILLVVPPWALVWFHQNIFESGNNILQIFLYCDALTAGFSFFTVLGAYGFSFAVYKLVDYIRFGKA